MQFETANGVLIARNGGEMLRIEPWGKNSLRVRATMLPELSNQDWALTETPESSHAEVECHEVDHWVGDGTIDKRESASITNGRICAVVNFAGVITFYRDGKQFLREYYRSYDGTLSRESRCLKTVNREWNGIIGGSEFSLNLKFDSNDGEKIFGMGQYQQAYMDLKGCTLELAQKNTQASVPYLVSSKGYGLLWNNPAIGRATLGANVTEFTAESTRQIDYWINAANTPAALVEQYTELTGRVPMMPKWAMGFWQCKLRYQTQDEVLNIARKYKELNIPLSVIVIDFFHWTQQGDWCFDPEYFPDPKAMIDELHKMGVRVMISIWPTVDRTSVNYEEMSERDLLIRTDRGLNVTMECWGMECFIDPTNPETREFVWQKAMENYRTLGVDLFWLDEAEPEYTVQDFDIYRYYDGPALECANEYPARYSQTFFDGMKKEGIENPLNLVRCAWAGSQRYGALVWSGDVPSTFTYLRYQLTAGLNMGLAGIAWWTADIGGFHGANVHDPAFHELLMRWFQFGAFCPVMRLHGDRDPHYKPLGTTGGGKVASGADNEIWSYTPEIQDMMSYYILLRESMKGYMTTVMEEAHEKGTPVMKPLFYDYPADKTCWEIADEFLFGHDLLVAPVLYAGERTRTLYLPEGRWCEYETGKVYDGGCTITVDAPINRVPLFVKEGKTVFVK